MAKNNDAYEMAKKIADEMEKSFKAVASLSMDAAKKAVSSGLEYEAAFADAKKMINATDSEFAAISKGIVQMSKEAPVSAAAIAKVAEEAGQLGIEKEHLLDFTKVMVDLGEATNMSSSDAASSLKAFADATKMSADDYSRLGSVIVALGNNFAVTEADIANMAVKLAASGDLADLSEAQIMALSMAISSVGADADSGGAAMSQLLKRIKSASESGGRSLEKFSAVAGMSAEEFKQAYQVDAVGALAAFVDGLNDTERNGQSASAILKEMGLTEGELSNTILSIADANFEMSDAIETANRAWDENTALSNGAAQGYETTEGKIGVLKNTFTAFLLDIYDQIQGPLRQGIDFAIEVIEGLGGSFKEILPTAIGHVKNMGGAFLDFAGPFLEVGKWLASNPALFLSIITGVGSALATYKIASTILSITDSISKLLKPGPDLVLFGIAAGISAIAAAVTYFEIQSEEAARNNLAEHFGDITLSMEELEEAAKHIVGADLFVQLDALSSALDSSDTYYSNMKSAAEDLAKTQWKLSIGLEVDVQSYAASVEAFVQNAQEFVLSEGYAVPMAIDVLFQGSEDGEKLIEASNTFYASLSTQLVELSSEISGHMQDILKNGLTLETEEAVNELLSEIEEITTVLANAEMKTDMQMLELNFTGIDYSGVDLNSDTFMNLQNAITESTNSAIEGIDLSTRTALKSLNARLELEEDFTESMYEEEYEKIIQKDYERKAEAIINGYDFMYNTIMDSYGPEVAEEIQSINEVIDEELKNLMNGDYTTAEDWQNVMNSIKDTVMDSNLSSEAQDAIAKLMVGMVPTQEQLSNLKSQINAAEEVTMEEFEFIDTALTKMDSLFAASGDESAVWTLIGNALAENEDWSVLILTVKDQMYSAIDDGVINAIEDKQPEAKMASEKIINQIEKVLAAGVTTDIPLDLKLVASFRETGSIGNFNTGQFSDVKHYAAGGIITSPILATFAEEGPEAAIPLDGSANAISLWTQTGQILGMFKNNTSEASAGTESFAGLYNNIDTGETNTNNATITFSPNITINGNTSKEEVQEAVKMSQDDFEGMMQQYFKNNSRFSFA